MDNLQLEREKKFAESGKPYFQIFIINHDGTSKEFYLPTFNLARLCEKEEQDNKRYFGRIAEVQLWKMQNGKRIFQYVDGKKPAKEEPKKEVEQIAYSVRNEEGKEILSLASALAIDYAFKTIGSNAENPLFVHKLVKESLGREYNDHGTIRSTKKTVSYYVWCDDVKKRDFYGKIEQMNDNGYFEKEFDKLEDAFAYAKSLVKGVSLADDYLVYVERIVRELDEDGDVIVEDYEDMETFDIVEDSYKAALVRNRFALEDIKRNICGTSPASELARFGIDQLLETEFRYDYVINDAHLDCFELESEIRELDEVAGTNVNDELIEEAAKIFITTAGKLKIALRHADEY